VLKVRQLAPNQRTLDADTIEPVANSAQLTAEKVIRFILTEVGYAPGNTLDRVNNAHGWEGNYARGHHTAPRSHKASISERLKRRLRPNLMDLIRPLLISE
jgi:hypothetical protein